MRANSLVRFVGGSWHAPATAAVLLLVTGTTRLCGEAVNPVAISLNPSSGQYQEDVVDLNVMIQGGRVDVGRRYDGTSWSHGWLSQPVRASVKSAFFEAATGLQSGKSTIEIEADSVLYRGLGFVGPSGAVTGGVFTSASGDKIEAGAAGWDWKLSDGRRARLDLAGHLLSHESAGGSTTRFGYDAATNHIVAVFDHWTNQVLWIAYASNGQPASVRDAAISGRSVAYDYDAAGRLTNVTDVLGGRTSYAYDDKGRLASLRWPNGEQRRLTYRVDGTVGSILDANGRGDVFDYNYDTSRDEYYMSRRRANGTVEEQWMDRSFHVIRKAVNGVVVLADEDATQAPVKNPPVVTFAENGLPSVIQYADGTWGRFEFAGQPSRLVREWTSAGLTNLYQYDLRGNMTNAVQMISSSAVRSVAVVYDSLGNVLETRMAGDESVPAASVRVTYGSNGVPAGIAVNGEPLAGLAFNNIGLVTAFEDGAGRRSALTYDEAGRLTAFEGADGANTHVVYDGFRVLLTNDADAPVEVVYNAQGQPLTMYRGGENVLTCRYDDLGRLVEARRGTNGFLETYTYDSLDRVVTVNNEHDGAMTMVYDDQRPELAVPLGVVMSTYAVMGTRDEAGRLVRMDVVAGSNRTPAARFNYDALGRVIAENNPMGLETRFTYDGDGQLASWSNALQGEVRHEWNVQGLLKRYRDGSGRVVEYRYDAHGRMTNELENGQVVMRRGYDAAGQLSWSQDALGKTTDYSYDPAGRLTQEVVRAQTTLQSRHLMSGPPGGSTTTIEYVQQKPAVRENDTAKVTIKLDSASRPTQETLLEKQSGVTTKIQYKYKDDLLTKLTVNGSNVWIIDRDDLGRASRVRSDKIDVALPRESLDLWNRPQVIDTGLLKVERTYDKLGNLVSQRTVVAATGQVLLNETATYNELQRVTSVSGAAAQTWQYDALGRVTGVTHTVLGSTQIPRRPDSAESPGADVEIRYDLQTSKLLQYGAVSYEWDAAGSVTRRTDEAGAREFTRDAHGLIEQVKDDGGNVLAEYTYDGFNRRVAKTSDGVTTHYIYNGTQLVQEYDSAGRARTYVYQPGSEGPPIAFQENGKVYRCVSDILGRVVSVVDDQGNSVWRAEYGLRNEPTVHEGGLSFELLQRGVWLDPDLGLYAQMDGTGYLDPVSGTRMEGTASDVLSGVNPSASGYVSGIRGYDKGGEYKATLLSEACAGAGKVLRGATGLAALPVAALTWDLSALKVKPYDFPDDVCSYLYTVNGIRSNSKEASALADEALRVVSQINGGEKIHVVGAMTNLNSSGLFGLLDGVQCLLGHVGVKQLSDTKMAEMMHANIEQCRAQGRGPDRCCLYVYAHSQGTQIASSALEALDPEDRPYVRYIGIEGQSLVNRRAAGAVANFVNDEDPIPWFQHAGAHGVYQLCGQETDTDRILLQSSVKGIANHMTGLYTGAIVDELSKREDFRCNCHK